MSPSFRTKYQAERPKLIAITLSFIAATILLYIFAPPFAGRGIQSIFNNLLHTHVVEVALRVLPLNFIAVSLLLMVFLFVKNQTRYFAFPTDVFLHKLLKVTIVISILVGLMAGWGLENGMYVEVNPLLAVYDYGMGYFPSWHHLVANLMLFCTIWFLPLFLFAMVQLDYDYLLAVVVGYSAAFLSSILTFIYDSLLSGVLSTAAQRFAIPNAESPVFNFIHLIPWVLSYIVYFVFIRYYDREHKIAESTGAAIHVPTVKRRHVLGFVWRPGRKQKRGSMIALFGALLIIIVIVGILVWSGFL